MTRFTENEKVTLRRAMTPAATTRTEVFGRLATAGRILAEMLRRRLRRAAALRELSALDDRMLADIGLNRSEIDAAATHSAGPERPGLAELFGELGELARDLSRAFIRWQSRRAAYRQLMLLDERLLRDIGLSRAEIPAVIASMRHGAAPAATEDGLVRPLRLWSRRRDAAKTLNALNDRMLDDIGMVRGDIESVADELATRSLRRPVNNDKATRAA